MAGTIPFNGLTDFKTLAADTFRLTSDLTTTDSDITANLERADDTLAGHVGTAMSQSSGIFTFPATSLYDPVSSTLDKFELIGSASFVDKLVVNLNLSTIIFNPLVGIIAAILRYLHYGQ